MSEQKKMSVLFREKKYDEMIELLRTKKNDLDADFFIEWGEYFSVTAFSLDNIQEVQKLRDISLLIIHSDRVFFPFDEKFISTSDFLVGLYEDMVRHGSNYAKYRDNWVWD